MSYCLDFQDALWGPAEYDIISLVNDPYVDLPQLTAEHFIQIYKDMCPTSISHGITDETLALQRLQRSWKVCGSFSSFFNMSGETSYLRYIEPALKHVYACLEYFSKDLKDLHLVFEDLGLLNIKKIRVVIRTAVRKSPSHRAEGIPNL